MVFRVPLFLLDCLYIAGQHVLNAFSYALVHFDCFYVTGQHDQNVLSCALVYVRLLTHHKSACPACAFVCSCSRLLAFCFLHKKISLDHVYIRDQITLKAHTCICVSKFLNFLARQFVLDR